MLCDDGGRKEEAKAEPLAICGALVSIPESTGMISQVIVSARFYTSCSFSVAFFCAYFFFPLVKFKTPRKTSLDASLAPQTEQILSFFLSI